MAVIPEIRDPPRAFRMGGSAYRGEGLIGGDAWATAHTRAEVDALSLGPLAQPVRSVQNSGRR